MKAAVIHAFGQPPRYEDFPEPTAGDGEVRVPFVPPDYTRSSEQWQVALTIQVQTSYH